jgi:SAM-dependent methyltransferase
MNNYSEATRFVGTTFFSGLAQFGILTRYGLFPEYYILEIGCGTLHLAKVLLPSLIPKHYYGIDPNDWLRKAVINENPIIKSLIDKYNPEFSNNTDFNGSIFNRKFDRIFSHSILSHASQKQLYQFLKNTEKVLKDDGIIISSIRIGNKDTNSEHWVYPQACFFTIDTILLASKEAGLTAIHKPEYREWYQTYCPEEIHDWFIFTKKN